MAWVPLTWTFDPGPTVRDPTSSVMTDSCVVCAHPHWKSESEQCRLPATGALPRVLSLGGVLGFRISVPQPHLCKGFPMLAPCQVRLRWGHVLVGCGAFNVGKADGGRRSRLLSLTLALVAAILLPQGPDALVDPVGLAPVQLMELSPLVQFEPPGIFFMPEQILRLHAVTMGGRQVILPIQEGGIRHGRVGRAVRTRVFPASSTLVHVPVMLSHILSLHPIPALGAGHLLSVVTSSSGHPAVFGMGWLSGW